MKAVTGKKQKKKKEVRLVMLYPTPSCNKVLPIEKLFGVLKVPKRDGKLSKGSTVVDDFVAELRLFSNGRLSQNIQ